MAKKKLTGADRRWGYPYGVDGTATASEAATILGYTSQGVWRLGKEGKIRRGKAGQRGWHYCIRSIREYQTPVEV